MKGVSQLALTDRLARLLGRRQNTTPAYGLPYAGMGGVGNSWPLTPEAWAYWNRWNGYPGTSFSYGHGIGWPAESYGYGLGSEWAQRIKGMSVPKLYATQPHLQTVVAFRARNIAQLPLHLYTISEGVHERDHSPFAGLFTAPNTHQTGYELLRDLTSSIDLYGNAYWIVAPSTDTASGWTIEPVPVPWVHAEGGTLHAPAYYLVRSPLNGDTEVRVPAENMVSFAAYAPDGIAPVSPVEALKDVLAEQIAAWEYRRQAWGRQGRAGTFLYRPKDAPLWSEQARDHFTEEWHEFQRDGARAGETPLLEDGMELRRVGFSAREEEWAEVSRLSLQTVCAVYHVAPAMLGMDGTSTYASVREFRSMLYTETLGPIIRQIEQRINQFVLPLVAPERPDLAVKFNIDAKLAGSFEEQASVLSTATGAPWMAVNEARALRNLPPLEGADGLVVPLNVTQGGQASPQSGEAPSIAVQNYIEAQTENEQGDEAEGAAE